jgi:hypothetical protein
MIELLHTTTPLQGDARPLTAHKPDIHHSKQTTQGVIYRIISIGST